MRITPAIFAVAAFAAASGAMAQSSVAVSGTVDLFAGSLKNSGDANRTAVVNNGGMTTSWFGFKASEDLGNGLKAEMLLTSFFQADTGVYGRFGGDNLFSRDANLALAGRFGRVELGRGIAPSFLPNVLFNPFGDSFAFSPLVIHSYVPSGAFQSRTWASTNASDSGWSNQIVYTTPDFNGLKANVHYQFGEIAGRSGRNNIGVNALYFNGPLGLTAFYHDAEVSNPNAGSAIVDATSTPINYASISRQKAYFVGASYDLRLAKLYGTYQHTTNDAVAGAEMKDKTFTLGLSAPVGQGSVLLAYADTKRSGSLVGAELERDTTTVGYDYNLSKRTDLYAVYSSDKITNADRAGSFGLGMRHRF